MKRLDTDSRRDEEKEQLWEAGGVGERGVGKTAPMRRGVP
jgi:hypothetical protein